jgi:hypothetical protein
MRYFVDALSVDPDKMVGSREFRLSLISDESAGQSVNICENTRLKKPSISVGRSEFLSSHQ